MAQSMTLSTIFTAIDRITGPARTIFGKVDKGASKANRGISAAGKGMAGFARFARVAVAAVATGAIAKGLQAFAEKGDEIDETSRMLGIGAEALQELRFAAEKEGMSVEGLTTGFKQLNRNVGDLKAGQGGLLSQLKATNPALARQLRGVKSTEEAFNLMVDAIGAETNTAKRAALAQAAFGKSGQELIKIAAGGTAGLAKLREEARATGSIMSGDLARAGSDFNDAMQRAKATLSGLAQGPLTRLLELITPLIQRFTDWTTANKGLINAGIDTFFNKIVQIFETVGPVAGKALGELSAILPPLLDLIDPILQIFVALSPLIITAAQAISAVLVPALQLLKPILEAIGAVLLHPPHPRPG